MTTEGWGRAYLSRIAAASTLAWGVVFALCWFTLSDAGHGPVAAALTAGAVVNPVANVALAALAARTRPDSWMCRGATNRWIFGGALAVLTVVSAFVVDVVAGVVLDGFGGVAAAAMVALVADLLFGLPVWMIGVGVLVGPPRTGLTRAPAYASARP